MYLFELQFSLRTTFLNNRIHDKLGYWVVALGMLLPFIQRKKGHSINEMDQPSFCSGW